MMRLPSWLQVLSSAVFVLAISVHDQPAEAEIVALDIDLPLDRIGVGQPFKIGDHHRARIFYDDTQVSPVTHRMRVLHMQHLVSNEWVPAHPDLEAMPMSDAWLDIGQRPYRYHYSSALTDKDGSGTLVDFDAVEQRMLIRRLADGALIVSAPCIIEMRPVTGLDIAAVLRPAPAYAMHEVRVLIDQVGEPGATRIGDVDRVRVVYDQNAIDPETQRVKLTNFQHFIRGRFLPEHPDVTMMPMSDAWMDLSTQPYRMHFHAAVTHGIPVVIDVSEDTGRLTIRAQGRPPDAPALQSGSYMIDPRPITGHEAKSAATPANADAKAGQPGRASRDAGRP